MQVKVNSKRDRFCDLQISKLLGYISEIYSLVVHLVHLHAFIMKNTVQFKQKVSTSVACYYGLLFSWLVECRFFFANCTSLLTKTQEEKFEDVFLIKIASN